MKRAGTRNMCFFLLGLTVFLEKNEKERKKGRSGRTKFRLCLQLLNDQLIVAADSLTKFYWLFVLSRR